MRTTVISGFSLLHSSAWVLPEKQPHLLNGKRCLISPCMINRTFSGSSSSLVAQIWVTPISPFKQIQYHEGDLPYEEEEAKLLMSLWKCVTILVLPLSPKPVVHRLSLLQTDTIKMQGLYCNIISNKYVWTHRHRKVGLGPVSQKEALEQKAGTLNLVPSPSCCSVAMSRKAQKHR